MQANRQAKPPAISYSYLKKMAKGNVLFAYNGEMSSALIDSLIALLEAKMDSDNEERMVRKKVFNIMVEMLQNQYHHAVKLENAKASKGFKGFHTANIIVMRSPDAYAIITGNYVPQKEVGGLKAKIRKVNDLSPDELKALYQEIRNTTELSEKGTAGLGLIDMARKSKNRLDFRFSNVNEHFAFFALRTEISRTN